MNNPNDEFLAAVREKIIEAIDRSDRGKWSIKIKTLLGEFGFVARQRVRQSSFLTVLDTLTQWGIEYQYRDDSANDYITLSRAAKAASVPAAGLPRPGVIAPPLTHFSAI